jgi:hypothetical protein
MKSEFRKVKIEMTHRDLSDPMISLFPFHSSIFFPLPTFHHSYFTLRSSKRGLGVRVFWRCPKIKKPRTLAPPQGREKGTQGAGRKGGCTRGTCQIPIQQRPVKLFNNTIGAPASFSGRKPDMISLFPFHSSLFFPRTQFASPRNWRSKLPKISKNSPSNPKL